MRVAKILQNDLANGPGLRTSVFVSGCDHNCPGCHATDLQEFSLGYEFHSNMIEQIYELLTDRGVHRDLSILGGEPLHPKNIEDIISLCKEIKIRDKEIKIWVWTGYRLSEKNFSDIIRYIDVLIDGKFDKSKTKGNHPWRGSNNQILYVKNEQGIMIPEGENNGN